MVRHHATRFAVAAVVACSSVAASQQSGTEERRVDSLFSRFAGNETPGLAVAVVRDGKIVLGKGYGLANLEHRIPITPSTVFDVASVSKQFTGLAVAMLVEQGRIKLTDDIRKYIPELADVGHVVTIDHLVHHTSGYRDWPGSLVLAGWRFDDVISYAQILRFATNQRSLNFVPGSEHMYSNTGYNLLAEMVRRVTGKPFREWTDEHLFRPLGMNDSHFQDDHARLVRNRAYGYGRPGGTFVAVPNNLTALGSSSLFSTVNDLSKWVINFDDPKVGGAAAMALTRTRGVLNDGSPVAYAFGIAHGEYRGQPIMSHSGGWATFSTFVVHFPRQRFGVVVLSNGGTGAAREAFSVADIYLDTVLGPRPAAAQRSSPPPVNVDPAVLDRYVGLYRLGPGWYVRIRRDGRALKTQATREAEVPMTASSDTSFWVESYNAPMVFKHVRGQPARLTYRGRTFPQLANAPQRNLAEYAGEYESEELETRYRVVVRHDTLVMVHPRHGVLPLTRLWNDDFNGFPGFSTVAIDGPRLPLRSVEFQRDGGGRVVGFSVLVDERSRDIRFIRRR